MIPRKMSDDVSQIVSGIMKSLREQAPKGGLVRFDFTDTAQFVVEMVQRMLRDRGFTVFGVPADDGTTTRVYVNSTRRERGPPGT